MNFSSTSVCDKQLCIFWCPFATFSLRHFSLAKSVDAVKNWLCWKVALCLQNVFIFWKTPNTSSILVQLRTFHLRRLVLDFSCCMSVISLIWKESSDGQLFVHATNLGDSSTVPLSWRNNPIDICLILTNFLNGELTFLAQSFVIRDQQKDTTAIASILKGVQTERYFSVK